MENNTGAEKINYIDEEAKVKEVTEEEISASKNAENNLEKIDSTGWLSALFKLVPIFIGLLEKILHMSRSEKNASPRVCLAAFREKRKCIFRFLCFLDFILMAIVLSMIIFVISNGLNISLRDSFLYDVVLLKWAC